MDMATIMDQADLTMRWANNDGDAKRVAPGVCFGFQTMAGSSGACPLWVDAVEKVRSMPPTRNNRIKETDFLNRSCAFDAGFESMLLGDPSQNPFSTVSVIRGRSIQRPAD